MLGLGTAPRNSMREASQPRRFVPRKFLYRRAGVCVIGILLIGGTELLPGVGQMPQLKRPEESPVEKPAEPPPKKLVNEPRAIGLLQLNASGKGSLIPVAIRIDGKFYDASVYKADPVPMALDGGTVYEVEKDGESQGLFTIRGALHNKNPDSSTPWLGAGTYVANGSEPANVAHKAEDKPRGLDADENDAPPKLTRARQTTDPAGQSQEAGAAANPGSAGSSGSAGTTNGTGATGTTPDSNAGTGTGSSKSAPTQAPSTTQSSPEKPKANQKSSGQSGPDQDSQNNDAKPQSQNSQNYYRPTLRRGKPIVSAPTDAEDDAALATDRLTLPAKGTAADSGGGPQAKVQLVAAVSDAGGPQPESYKFFWKEGEEEDRKKQMLALATDEVRAYIAKLAKDTIPAKPVLTKSATSKSTSVGRKSKAKVESAFENVQFRAFDVWKNNQPVMILTADAQFPPAAGSDTPALVYNVVIAARTDIYGDLRKLYSGVTDKFHLDVTPKFELIDAVDVDGDGRAELLFRETADAGTGYIIYRPTGDTLWKMFDSLNPQ
jgi:hypothetical protein